MTEAYYSAVLDHPLQTVWTLIRDFNNYPAYIEGVSESLIEDDRRGDEVGAVRRFCYLGNWVRQRLADHSDERHSLTYAGIEPLPFPPDTLPDQPSPTRYEGTMRLMEIVEGNRTLIEWSVELDTESQDADRWRTQFQSWIPEWTQSLQRALTRYAGARYAGE
jgi:Polyketide cyclase / dehydrase and lipid transport